MEWQSKYPSLQHFGISDSSTTEDFLKKIEDTYQDDYNILELHSKVLRKLQWERKYRLRELAYFLKNEDAKRSKPQTIVEREASNRRIVEWQKEYTDISSGHRYKTYMEQVTPLIKKYQDLGTLQKTISFGKKSPSSTPPPSSSDPVRLELIEDYLKIASHYLQLDIVREVDTRAKCPGCNSDLDEVECTPQGMLCCRNCNLIRESVIKTPFYKDGNRVNNSTGNNYEDEVNFYKGFLRFQGKQSIRLPDSLMSDLDDYFSRRDLPLGQKIRQMSLQENGRRGNTDKDDMYRALSDKGYANHYEDINLICHLYWGWSLPDLSHLEDALMEKYRESQKVYEELPKRRHSSMNGQYRLFWLLKELGYPCASSDFKMIKTSNIIDDYEELREQMCEKLGWKYIDLR